jgi:beta-fructofuranosidase
MWECPNFFSLGGQHVLIVSVQADTGELLYPACFAGAYDGERFTPAQQRVLVQGGTFYAPQVLRLDDGRTLMWGWLKEARDDAAAVAAGWSGVMSLPIELTWLPQGTVGLRPVDELKALRRQHWHFGPRDLAAGGWALLPGVAGDCLELDAVFEPGPNAEFGLALRCSAAAAGAESAPLRLVYDGGEARLRAEPGAESTPVPLDAQGRLRLRAFLDRSVLEAFANDTACLAERCYLEAGAGLAVGVFGRAGRAALTRLDVWALSASNA